jgi:hypothetical protein
MGPSSLCMAFANMRDDVNRTWAICFADLESVRPGSATKGRSSLWSRTQSKLRRSYEA